MPLHLQHVSIPRPPGSEALARAFYGDLLGLEEIPTPLSVQYLDVLWFKGAGDSELHIFSEEPRDDPSWRHFCLIVEDLAGMRAKLAAAGHAPYDVDAIPGRPRFLCRDPFGNIIEFGAITGDYLELQDLEAQARDQ